MNYRYVINHHLFALLLKFCIIEAIKYFTLVSFVCVCVYTYSDYNELVCAHFFVFLDFLSSKIAYIIYYDC